MKKRIEELKKEKNAIVLAHYYVSGEIQEVADHVGDSYYLSKVAMESDADVLVVCGVSFMGESAKLLNPQKTVLLPEPKADCPMAHMAAIHKIEQIKKTYDDVAVVCYINSTAEIKAHSDVCVTSANALQIVEALEQEYIYFIPDENLGRYIAEKLPNKKFIHNDGFCHVHKNMTPERIQAAKNTYPGAEVLMHPECTSDSLKLADYIGSTSGIIDYATNSNKNEFIIATETGVFYELEKKNPEKKFYPVSDTQICPDMKMITLEKVAECMEHLTGEVILSKEVEDLSNKALKRMMELS